jgi:hypothetical protein
VKTGQEGMKGQWSTGTRQGTQATNLPTRED